MHTIKLSGEWQLARTRLRELHNDALPSPSSLESFGPVVVPGHVHQQIGVAEPYRDVPETTDVNQWEWLYTRTFRTPAQPGHVYLRMDATDYFADIWVNGTHLGSNDGMYVDWEVDVSDVLRPHGEENEVSISVACPWRPKGRMDELQSATFLGARNPSTEYLKGVHIFHWDGWAFRGFALLPFGLWQDVWLDVRQGPTVLRAAVATAAVTEGEAELEVALECHNAGEAVDVLLDIEVSPETFSGETLRFQREVAIPAGYGDVSFRFQLADAQLWWTWDTGPQNLYRLTVGGRSTVFGVRTVHRDAETLVTYLNGRRLFLRGTWDTPWAFEAEADDHTLWRNVEMLVEANCNHTVFHGFVPREATYDAADRLGILVHQQFPFHQFGPHRLAEASHPRRQAFLDEATRQCDRILRRLRGHASLALWAPFAEVRDDAGNWIWGEYTDIADSILELVARLDIDAQGHPSFCDFGEQHLWEGAIYGEFSDHYPKNFKFISEYGTPALPVAESLRDILPETALWNHAAGLEGQFGLPIDVDEYSFIWGHEHQAFAISVGYLLRLVDSTMPTFDRWVDAAGWYQRFGIRYCTEIYRRKRFAEIAGTRMWSFRDATPGAKCSVLDYWQRPKMGFEGLRESYAPVLLSIDERYPLAPLPAGQDYTRDLHVINDLHRPLEVDVQGRLYDIDGAELYATGTCAVSVEPDSSLVVPLHVELPSREGPALLRLQAVDGDGSVVSQAEYWLNIAIPAFEQPVRVLVWGQRRYNAPIVEALERVHGVEVSVYDEERRDPHDHTWCADLGARYDVLWATGWERLVHRFDRDELSAIREAVAGGLGFIHSGGQGSFHGGDSFGAQLDATPLDDVLPVALRRIDFTWDVKDRVVTDERARAEGFTLQGMRNYGYHRVTPLADAEVLARIDGDPLVVAGHFGRGRTIALTSSLVKTRRGLQRSPEVEGVNPVELPDPIWELSDIRDYGMYWPSLLQLAVALVARAAGRPPVASPLDVQDRIVRPLPERLADLGSTHLSARIVSFDWDEHRGVSRGAVEVTNSGAVCARLVRGGFDGGTSNRRFLDGWVDLLPEECTTLRFEIGVRPEDFNGRLQVSAQNTEPAWTR